MSALLPLRPYQRDALNAVAEALAAGTHRPAVVLPTGSGKTVMFAQLAVQHRDAHPRDRVLVLVHTDELVSQAYATITGTAPHLDVGVVKAERNEVSADVIVASVQTLRRLERRTQIMGIGLVIVDECHHATAPTYRTILEHYGCLPDCEHRGWDYRDGPPCSDCYGTGYTGPPVPAVGFTATLARGDGGPLGQIWQSVAYTRDISWMVRRRYLIPPRGKSVAVPDFALESVRSAGGDYREGDLGDALVDSLAPATVARAYNIYAMNRCASCLEAAEVMHEEIDLWLTPNRCPNTECGTNTGAGRQGIVFLPTVRAANVFADAFNAEGIKCEVVHGEQPLSERRAVLARLDAGVTQVVANCMVLTEGFDSPAVSCIVVARPTKSAPLYVQMVGRGLRVDPGVPYEDQDCLILAVTPEAAGHDLRSLVDLSMKPIKEARDGVSLVELEDEWEIERAERDRFYTGPVEVRDFDPLAARSTRVWKRTDAGVYFLPAGKTAFVFLSPGAGPARFDVAWCARRSSVPLYVCCGEVPAEYCTCGKVRHSAGGFTFHRDLDLEMAMAWAEDLAVDMGADPYETLTRKAAPWRRKPASKAAIGYARSLRIKVPEGKPPRAGELSDAIDKVTASRRIDPIVEKITRKGPA